jgi:putative phosphoesterase
MRVAIISDTHDQLELVQRAADLIRAAAVDCVLHCGDITHPDSLEAFADLPLHVVLGNCDLDPQALGETIQRLGGQLHARFGQLDLAGHALAWTHGHRYDLLHSLIDSQQFAFVFHGHTHLLRDEQIGATRVINPGAFVRVAQPTFALLDLSDGRLIVQPVHA